MTQVYGKVALIGLGLIAGAEAAHRFKDRVADPRVPQALSGAGLADGVLWGGFGLTLIHI